MYKKILVPLENSWADATILSHVKGLAALCGAEILLVHVADGFVARNQEKLNLQDSEEIRNDRTYLEDKRQEFNGYGIVTSAELLRGEPAKEILRLAVEQKCDLIALATHGHRLLGDLVLGSVATEIRHGTDIPVLMIRGQR